MSQFVEVKTSELIGPALDWAVAKALGYECGRLPGKDRILGCNTPDGLQYVIGQLYGAPMAEEIKARFFRPSTDWVQGGPLWDEWATAMEHYDGWLVAVVGGDATGPTKLIALCRAIVVAKLGDVVRVPAELAGVASDNR